MDTSTLTPTLNDQQIRQNIDALRAKNVPVDQVQSYVNNYTKSSDGTYALKNQKVPGQNLNNPFSTVNNIGEQAAAGVNQINQGFQQTQQNVGSTNPSAKGNFAQSAKDALGAVGQMGRGVLNEAAGAVNTAFSPVSAIINDAGKVPGISDAVQAIKKHVVDPASNAISNMPALQKFMTENPHADEIAANLISLGTAFIGGKEAPKIGDALENSVSKITPEGTAASKYVEGTAKTMADYAKDPDVIASGGASDVPSMVKTVQKNIVDGIGSQIKGVNPEAVTQISKLDPKSFSSIDEFTKAANAIIEQTHPTLLGKASNAIAGSTNAVSNSAKNIKGSILDTAGNITNPLEGIQNKLSRANVPENLGSTIDRLNDQPPVSGIGKIKQSPLDLYNHYASQEAKFKNNIKEDTAIGHVGSKDLGPAFDKVVKMRREAGALMGSEMERVGHIPTDITESFPKFETELNKSGVTYEDGKIQTSKTSKITDEDASLLDNYVEKLNNLGSNPTAAELDAFLSKTPKDLDVYKTKNNITKVTDAERMIKQNLRDLSSNLTKKSNPEFSKYEKAKGTYKDLSGFLDEGSGFVGKKTASGDYAKDASVLKSSVQSILNGGKKDWLIKLEHLTGVPVLDKSMIALQAMKDAGNYRGNSLLDVLSPKSIEDIPTSVKGVVGKALNKGIEIGKEKLVGSPADQTRRIILERMKNAQTTVPSIFEESKAADLSKTMPSKTKSFSDFHPADQAFLTKFAEDPTGVSPKTLKYAQDTWNEYGFRTPKSPTKFADMIKIAKDSALEKDLNSELDSNMGR